MTTFKQLEIGDVFRHHCMFFTKTDSIHGTMTSDDKFEEGRAKFLPYFGQLVRFKETVQETSDTSAGNHC